MPTWVQLSQLNAAFLRPFRQRVDLETVVLLLVLLLALAGQWHLILERVDMGGRAAVREIAP